MEGDADGSQEAKIKFDEDDTTALKAFIMAATCCCNAYPNGRGGYDEYTGLPEYDAFFNDDLPNEWMQEDCDEGYYSDYENKEAWDAMKALNPKNIHVEHPSDSSYVSTSFEHVSVGYKNENGDSFNVDIKFNKEEQQRLKECNDFFK